MKQVERAKIAVVVAFAVNGLAFASFMSRAPAVGETLALSTGQLGLLLLCLSAGAVTGLPLSGPLVQRVGPGRSVLVGGAAETVGVALLAVGLFTGSVLPAAIGLFVTGLGTGVWDVAMNVGGAAVEQRLGRTLMPKLHAAFSLGTVAGAALGAATAALGVPLAALLVAIAVLIPVVVLVVTPRFLPGVPAEEQAAGGSVLAAWREPRTLLIGLMVLAFAFTEGSANDWIAYALSEGYGAGETVGAIAFGVFVTAMTAGRLLGGTVLERFGRVVVLRAAAGFALVGLLLVIIGGSVPVALAGALLWGIGASLGFPVGMSAAADDPARAAVRVSVVSSVGYTAFLAGPPLIGLLAEGNGILNALFVVLGALVLGLAASGSARPLTGTTRSPEVPARR